MILGRFLDHRESVFNQASAAQMSGFLQKPSGHRSLTVAPFEPSELETHGTHGTHPAKTIRWISLEVGGILPTQLGDSSSTKSVIYLYESPIYIYKYLFCQFFGDSSLDLEFYPLWVFLMVACRAFRNFF